MTSIAPKNLDKWYALAVLTADDLVTEFMNVYSALNAACKLSKDPQTETDYPLVLKPTASPTSHWEEHLYLRWAIQKRGNVEHWYEAPYANQNGLYPPISYAFEAGDTTGTNAVRQAIQYVIPADLHGEPFLQNVSPHEYLPRFTTPTLVVFKNLDPARSRNVRVRTKGGNLVSIAIPVGIPQLYCLSGDDDPLSLNLGQFPSILPPGKTGMTTEEFVAQSSPGTADFPNKPEDHFVEHKQLKYAISLRGNKSSWLDTPDPFDPFLLSSFEFTTGTPIALAPQGRAPLYRIAEQYALDHCYFDATDARGGRRYRPMFSAPTEITIQNDSSQAVRPIFYSSTGTEIPASSIATKTTSRLIVSPTKVEGLPLSAATHAAVADKVIASGVDCSAGGVEKAKIAEGLAEGYKVPPIKIDNGNLPAGVNAWGPSVLGEVPMAKTAVRAQSSSVLFYQYDKTNKIFIPRVTDPPQEIVPAAVFILQSAADPPADPLDHGVFKIARPDGTPLFTDYDHGISFTVYNNSYVVVDHIDLVLRPLSDRAAFTISYEGIAPTQSVLINIFAKNASSQGMCASSFTYFAAELVDSVGSYWYPLKYSQRMSRIPIASYYYYPGAEVGAMGYEILVGSHRQGLFPHNFPTAFVLNLANLSTGHAMTVNCLCEDGKSRRVCERQSGGVVKEFAGGKIYQVMVEATGDSSTFLAAYVFAS